MSPRSEVRSAQAKDRGWTRAWLLFTALAVAAVGVGVFAIQRLPVTYSATSVIALRPLTTADLNADGVSMIAHEYSIFLSADHTAELGAKDVGLIRVGDGIDVTANQDPETSTIRVTVKAPTSTTAVALANSIAELGEAHATQDSHVRAVQVAPAVRSGVVVGPPRHLYLAGLAMAVVLSGLAVLYVRRGGAGTRRS